MSSSRGVTGVRGVRHCPYPRPLRLWAAPTAAAAAAVCGGVRLWREAAASGCGEWLRRAAAVAQTPLERPLYSLRRYSSTC
eukprot:scaffold79990_cov70-Phaeocystis_antarctica.AAC.3